MLNKLIKAFEQKAHARYIENGGRGDAVSCTWSDAAEHLEDNRAAFEAHDRALLGEYDAFLRRKYVTEDPGLFGNGNSGDDITRFLDQRAREAENQ